ncbi:MAG: SBBP repeat-containing protein [Dehalococcoidia bacterium]
MSRLNNRRRPAQASCRRARRTSRRLTAMLLLGVLVAVAFVAWPQASNGDSVSRSTAVANRASAQGQALNAYASLPLSFELNQGQAAASVDYLAHGGGYTLALSGGELSLALRAEGGVRGAGRGEADPHGRSLTASAARSANLIAGVATPEATTAVQLQLLGARTNPEVLGEAQLPGRANYFVGSDPEQWHTNIPTYARVRYRDIYPGLDVVYYGNQGRLEYDLVLGPNVDPSQIALDFAGNRGLRLDEQGNLIIQSDGGGPAPAPELQQAKPVAYQDFNGVHHPVSAGYFLSNDGRVGITLGDYDRSEPLTIDPTLVYSTYLGGSLFDQGNAIAVEATGSAYIAGATASFDFPTMNPEQTVNKGAPKMATNAFITKLNTAGTAIVYSTFLGGSNGDSANAIAVDGSGEAFIAGSTRSTDFPTTSTAYQSTLKSSNIGNAFMAELNGNGTMLLYSSYLGGSRGDAASGIAVASGRAYVTGYTNSLDFPTSPTAYQPAPLGNSSSERNAFVTAFNPAGNGPASLVYSTYLGGSSPFGFGGQTTGIAVDTAGNAYVTGTTQSADFPTTPGAYQPPCGSACGRVFVTKLNPTGSGLVYSTRFGSKDTDLGEIGSGIAVDGSGDAFVTGTTSVPVAQLGVVFNFPTTAGVFQSHIPQPSGEQVPGVGFVTKLNPSGAGLIYSTFLGGNGGFEDGVSPSAIAIDGGGNAYITGGTGSQDFPTTPGAPQTTHPRRNSDSTAFVSKLNPAATRLLYSTYLGGTGRSNRGNAFDGGAGIAVDASGNAYVTGSTNVNGFPTQPTPGAYQSGFRSTTTFQSAFVAKIAPTGPVPAPTLTGISPAAGSGAGFTPITLTGSNLTSGLTLTIGGLRATGEQNSGFIIVSADGTSITATTPYHPVIGDVNADGQETAVDALYILRFVAKLGPTQGCPAAGLTSTVDVVITEADGQSATLPGGYTYNNADVNNDGQVNAVDALCVLRSVAQLPATDACPNRPNIVFPGVARS